MADYLSTIGILVERGVPDDTTGETKIFYGIDGVTDFDDIGGDAEGIDATVLMDKQTRTIPGLKSQDTWTLTYNYTNREYSWFNTFVNRALGIRITFADGTILQNTGILAFNKVTGVSVNTVLQCTLGFNLQEEWKVVGQFEPTAVTAAINKKIEEEEI